MSNYFIVHHLNHIQTLRQNQGNQQFSYDLDLLKYKNITEQESKGLDRVILKQYLGPDFQKRIIVDVFLQEIEKYVKFDQMRLLLLYYKYCCNNCYKIIKKDDYRQFKKLILGIYPTTIPETWMLYQLFKKILLQKPLEQDLFMQYQKLFSQKQFYELAQRNPVEITYEDKIRRMRLLPEDTTSTQYEYICAIKLNALHYLDYAKMYNTPTKIKFPLDDTGIDLVDEQNKICYQCKWKWTSKVIPYGILATFLASTLKFFPGYKMVVVSTEKYELENILSMFEVEYKIIDDYIDLSKNDIPKIIKPKKNNRHRRHKQKYQHEIKTEKSITSSLNECLCNMFEEK